MTTTIDPNQIIVKRYPLPRTSGMHEAFELIEAANSSRSHVLLERRSMVQDLYVPAEPDESMQRALEVTLLFQLAEHRPPKNGNPGIVPPWLEKDEPVADAPLPIAIPEVEA